MSATTAGWSHQVHMFYSSCGTKLNDVVMDAGDICAKDIFWIILSHHAAKHHACALKAQLTSTGVKAGNLRVAQGFRRGHLDDKRKVGHP